VKLETVQSSPDMTVHKLATRTMQRNWKIET